ncbi:hypothetical protein BHE90_005848 [Fusarium euwallaceae]|uniref:Uncharacterized protein n=1 Tax=Fusarium euwallaceae TaxID=1147111 RepID=A0A430LVB5_9HYPO|nr:hypothetical protein BHE90_005848 [Fusarium euwallaceae]
MTCLGGYAQGAYHTAAKPVDMYKASVVEEQANQSPEAPDAARRKIQHPSYPRNPILLPFKDLLSAIIRP